MANEKQDLLKTPTETLILTYLATEGAKSKWNLKNDLKKSYGNIHDTIGHLNQKGLIFVERSENSSKNKVLEVEYYNLTTRGLLKLLCSNNEISKDFDVIAEKQAKISVLFLKWSFFKKEKIDGYIKGKLPHLRKQMNDALVRIQFRETILPPMSDKDAEGIIIGILLGLDSLFLMPKIMGEEKNVNAPHLKPLIEIWKVCKKDPELKVFFEDYISQNKKHAEKVLEYAQNMERIYKDL